MFIDLIQILTQKSFVSTNIMFIDLIQILTQKSFVSTNVI